VGDLFVMANWGKLVQNKSQYPRMILTRNVTFVKL
jgi:hypothetical protein